MRKIISRKMVEELYLTDYKRVLWGGLAEQERSFDESTIEREGISPTIVVFEDSLGNKTFKEFHLEPRKKSVSNRQYGRD